ncbi:hypothetical protein EST38_g13358, partial [Candolleomyces aberdarensis]
GEFMHRYPKRWYQRTSKKNVRKEIARHERKVARIRRIRQKINEAKKKQGKDMEEQKAAAKNPDIHHYIGTSQNCPVSLIDLSRGNADDTPGLDPLGKGFVQNLREHLLPRVGAALFDRQALAGSPSTGEAGSIRPQPSLDSSWIHFKDYRMFSHKIMRVKYTTYEVRRDEDVIHINSDGCNIMVHNPEHDDNPHAHPFLYARVLGIYHAHVSYAGEFAIGTWDLRPVRLEFLWVRWYKLQDSELEGRTRTPLDRLTFPPVTSPNAASFIDPNTVLRAAHIIPRFCLGRVHEHGQGQSEMAGDQSDWKEYFVNRFADRDMFMRYQIGMAVGHLPEHISKVPVAPNTNHQEEVHSNVSPKPNPVPDVEECVDDKGGMESDSDSDDGETDHEEVDGEEVDGEDDIEFNNTDLVMFGY